MKKGMLKVKSSIEKEMRVVRGRERAGMSFPRGLTFGPATSLRAACWGEVADKSRHMLSSRRRKSRERERFVSSNYLQNCVK